jgi:cellulose biosynthesis protein BcsQ
VGKKPYVLVLGSHKGGTGRTTHALALAHVWGQAGLRVSLVDADPAGAARLVAVPPEGICAWRNVKFFPRLPESGRSLLGSDLILIDAPPLTEASAQRILRLADGLVLSCLADPLSLRTIPVAVSAIQRARQHNPRLNLLGLLIGIFNEHDDLQRQMLAYLRETQADLLLEPPIPYQQEICDWPLEPGRSLPAGPARDSYEAVASMLDTTFVHVAAV